MTEGCRRWRGWGRPGAGVVVALVLLALAEAALHSDAFMHRLRSVFAVGRAFDKVLYVETHRPRLVVLGNSRMDNAVDPATLSVRLGPDTPAFNLGLPGANATVLNGIVRRLDAGGALGVGRIERVLIGLDEGLIQPGDALGYEVFFADQPLSAATLPGFLRTHIHLWGYGGNLKQLREPAKLLQFLQALAGPVEPLGGGAGQRLGYRPGFGGAQDAEQVARQEAGSTAPPGQQALADFLSMLDLLKQRGVEVSVVFPPLLTRPVLYLDRAHPASGPYSAVLRELAVRGIPMYALGPAERMGPAEFVNAGHLNDWGAQRFSAMLGEAMARGEAPRLVRVSAP